MKEREKEGKAKKDIDPRRLLPTRIPRVGGKEGGPFCSWPPFCFRITSL